MKFYVVARLSKPDASLQKTTALRVRFVNRAEAQEACDVLNIITKTGEPGFIVEEHEEPERAFRQSV